VVGQGIAIDYWNLDRVEPLDFKTVTDSEGKCSGDDTKFFSVFELNSELSDRVSKWQERLAPILEEEERRAEFDIHKYSEKILKESAQQGLGRLKRKSDGSSGASTSKVDFESIAQNCSQSDVCRLFLASLSLANSGNLKVEEGAPTYRFDLISSNVERPMETYRAPSWVVDGG
jgi:condensin-2 complex subunit H2